MKWFHILVYNFKSVAQPKTAVISIANALGHHRIAPKAWFKMLYRIIRTKFAAKSIFVTLSGHDFCGKKQQKSEFYIIKSLFMGGEENLDFKSTA